MAKIEENVESSRYNKVLYVFPYLLLGIASYQAFPICSILQGRERRFACFAKQQPDRPRRNFLATTYKTLFLGSVLQHCKTPSPSASPFVKARSSEDVRKDLKRAAHFLEFIEPMVVVSGMSD